MSAAVSIFAEWRDRIDGYGRPSIEDNAALRGKSGLTCLSGGGIKTVVGEAGRSVA